MANSRIYFKSESGGTTVLSRDTTANSGDLVLPASGNVVSVDTAVTDNAIARYDSTTGKLQNSGVIIDDNNNVSIGGTPSTFGGYTTVSLDNASNGCIYNIKVNGTETARLQAYSGVFNIAAKGASTNLTFETNGAERMRLDTNGNVGIGVSPSAWAGGLSVLQVQQANLTAAAGNDLRLGSNYVRDNTYYKYLNNGYATNYIQYAGGHQWSNSASGVAGNVVSWTNAMTLDASGNLDANFRIGSYIRSYYDASNWTLIRNHTVADTTPVYTCVIGAVTKSAILANGTYQSATNVYGSTSDIKLKENVVDSTPKLEKLMGVRVRNFNYIGQEEKQIGVIAQEIEQVFPGVVFETKDTEQVEITKTRDITDEEGNITQEEYTETETQETGEVTKNVKYSVIYMMMLKGMQEMRAEYTAEIESLKARIELLEEIGGAK